MSGFNDREKELIDCLQAIGMDIEKAQLIIDEGVNLNASYIVHGSYENVLSEILSNFAGYGKCREKGTGSCGDTNCEQCFYGGSDEINIGKEINDIIDLFLNNGFDVLADDGKAGAACLKELVHARGDKYVLEAAKKLLDAGAVDVVVDDESPSGVFGYEATFKPYFFEETYLGNVCEVVYQMIDAKNKGIPYQGINLFTESIGKQINHIYAIKDGEGDTFFSIDYPEAKNTNAFRCNLCMEYDTGFVIINRYADVWTDTRMPTGVVEDISQVFPYFVRRKINKIEIDNPGLCIKFDSGMNLQISTNYRKTNEEEKHAAYWMAYADK